MDGVELHVDDEQQFAWVTQNGQSQERIFVYKLEKKKSNNKVNTF